MYRTTSLSEIARELGVSKTALYRHFKDKDALSEAMFTVYFDDFASFIKGEYDRAVSETGDSRDLIMMRTIAEYYVRNKDAFIFSLIRVFNCRDKKNIENELRIRGIDFKRLADRKNKNPVIPSKIQLIMTTLVFSVGQFHRQTGKGGKESLISVPSAGAVRGDSPPADQVKSFLFNIEVLIKRGLGLDAVKINSVNYRDLELRAAEAVYEDNDENALLAAVAEAVAEAGPWDASMEMVAKRSGLSKSGLYAHFKNKQDMMSRFFITEFSRILNSARAQLETTKVPEEQLYLAIISVANYLRSRPEILMAMDWIRTMRLDLGKEPLKRLYKAINSIKQEAVKQQNPHLLVWIAQWMLFLIVSTMARCREHEDNRIWAKKAAEIPNESFRILYQFIALGLEGLNK